MTKPKPRDESNGRPLLVRCSYCECHWALLYLPMELHEVAQAIKHARCPQCGKGSEYIYVGMSTHP